MKSKIPDEEKWVKAFDPKALDDEVKKYSDEIGLVSFLFCLITALFSSVCSCTLSPCSVALKLLGLCFLVTLPSLFHFIFAALTCLYVQILKGVKDEGKLLAKFTKPDRR